MNKKIMRRSPLRIKFLIFKKGFSLIRQEKETFLSNANTHDVTDNKSFWKVPIIQDKTFLNDKELAKTF